MISEMETTSNHVCPVWLAYTFLLPLRKYQHDPVEDTLSLYQRGDECNGLWFCHGLVQYTNGKDDRFTWNGLLCGYAGKDA